MNAAPFGIPHGWLRFGRIARYYGIFWDWDGEKTYSKAELAERQGLTLCEFGLALFSSWYVLLCRLVLCSRFVAFMSLFLVVHM